MGKLRISMLGSSFTVNSPEDDEYLKKLLSYYQDITDAIKHSGNVLTPQQVSILAGITLVDELYKEKQRNANLLKQMENTESEGEEAESVANDLINKLDKFLEAVPNSDREQADPNGQLNLDGIKS